MITAERESDRGVRGSIGQLAPWEENAHARVAHACGRKTVRETPGQNGKRVSSIDPPKRSRVS